MLEEHRWVGLTQEEERHNRRESSNHSEDPEDPAPALCGYEVSSCYGPNDGAQHRSESVDGDDGSALFLDDEVCNRAATYRRENINTIKEGMLSTRKSENPPFVIGAEPKQPWKNRNAISIPRLELTAQATVKTVKPILQT